MVDFASPRPLDFLQTVALGRLPGWTSVFITGYNPDIDLATDPEDVWMGGGLYPFLTVASLLEIVSSSASDADAGIGARTVLVQGLNSSYLEINETVILNGVTPVALVNTYIRINSCIVTAVGSTLGNVGTITLRVPGPGSTLAMIGLTNGLGHNRAKQAIYTVPAEKMLFISSFAFNTFRVAGASESVEIGIFSRVANSATAPWLLGQVFNLNVQGTSFVNPVFPLLRASPSIFDIRATVLQVSADNFAVGADIIGVLGNSKA